MKNSWLLLLEFDRAVRRSALILPLRSHTVALIVKTNTAPSTGSWWSLNDEQWTCCPNLKKYFQWTLFSTKSLVFFFLNQNTPFGSVIFTQFNNIQGQYLVSVLEKAQGNEFFKLWSVVVLIFLVILQGVSTKLFSVIWIVFIENHWRPEQSICSGLKRFSSKDTLYAVPPTCVSYSWSDSHHPGK